MEEVTSSLPQPAQPAQPATGHDNASTTAPSSSTAAATPSAPGARRQRQPPQSHNTATDPPHNTHTPEHPAATQRDPARSRGGGSVRPRAEGARPQRKRQPCRFYGTKKGCRAGEQCPYRHDASRVRGSAQSADLSSTTRQVGAVETSTTAAIPPISAQSAGGVHSRAQGSQGDAEPQAVSRPTPQAEVQDPRAFQIGQIKKRYGASEESGHGGATTLRFGMPPSDPDFPFDINELRCTLSLPPDFPKAAPSLKVSNDVMERGYQLNVERGFNEIWLDLRQKTLLNAMKLLDRRLEMLLTGKKMETIKVVANAGPKASNTTAPSAAPKPAAPSAQLPAEVKPAPRPRPTIARLEEAKQKREAEVQHLRQRLGRHPQFKEEADGTMFTLPITPRKSTALPPQLHAVTTVRLIVPGEYDVDPPGIELLGVEGEACQNVEAAFTRRASKNGSNTLLGHINYLAQHMAAMATEKLEEPVVHPPPQEVATPWRAEESAQAQAALASNDGDKSHIKYIPRPPEWDDTSSDEDEGDEDYDSDGSEVSYSGSDSGDGKPPAEEAQPTATAPRETGILLSLPSLKLHNIELLELSSLSLTIKCDRCKETHDVTNLKPTADGNATAEAGKTVTCRKCSVALFVSIRPDLMHTSSQKAGYLDTESCAPLTLLPSAFTPTCSNCSTTAPGGVVAAPGASDTMTICRGCHTKMSFAIPEIKFLRIGPSSISLPLRGAKKQREQLGLVTGTELPEKGACKHYAKSFRWFRFSCCGKVFACDRCHDEHVLGPEGDGHAQEMANRMICGYCSREQVYRPRECGHCGSNVVKRRGRGFWEGGKGTRDPKAMSRKDPRKYKLRKKMKQKSNAGRAGGAKNA